MEALSHLFTSVSEMLSPASWNKAQSRIDDMDENDTAPPCLVDEEGSPEPAPKKAKRTSGGKKGSLKKSPPKKASSAKKSAKKTPKKTPKKTARSGKVRVKTEVQRRSRRSGANKKGFYSETNLAARAWSSGTGTSRDPYVL